MMETQMHTEGFVLVISTALSTRVKKTRTQTGGREGGREGGPHGPPELTLRLRGERPHLAAHVPKLPRGVLRPHLAAHVPKLPRGLPEGC